MGARTDRPLLPFAAAREALDATGTPLATVEQLALADADGRVLAASIVAPIDVPPVARSAMDGYALRAADTSDASTDAPVRLPIVGEAWAGRPWSGTLAPGAAIAIATGALVPDGADAVVMIEDTARDGDRVVVHEPAAAGRHITPQGRDVRTGATVLLAGDVLTPSRLGALAALGLGHVIVHTKPRVAILATGDEVVAAGRPLLPGQVYDVNTTTLAALVARHGGSADVRPRVGDDAAALDAAFTACLDADLVLVTGGSSVGERDYVLDAIAGRGRIVFDGVAIKPGKPTILGVASGRPVLGLSGNPSSCLSNGYLFVVPLLRRLAHLPAYDPRRITAVLAAAVTSPTDRRQFYMVRVEGDRAVPAFKGSGEITSIAHADGYIEIAEGVSRVDAGTRVEVVLY
jgi:molybdenum cofactor synthesis domain-containing protein